MHKGSERKRAQQLFFNSQTLFQRVAVTKIEEADRKWAGEM